MVLEHFVEVAHRTAVNLPPATAASVDHFTARVVAALRMRTGLVHLEFRLAEAGPTLMEVAVRTPGDFIMELLGLTYEMDWYELVVKAALSLPLPVAPKGPARYAASYLPVAAPGVVTEVRGLSDVERHPSAIQAEVRVAKGQVIAPLRSSAQRVGHVIMAADSPEALEAALCYVRDRLIICTEVFGNAPGHSESVV